jgi:hypothetical protein
MLVLASHQTPCTDSSRRTVSYLLQFQDNSITKDIIQTHPLSSYTGHYWYDHICEIPEQDAGDRLTKLMKRFFLECTEYAWDNWIRIFNPGLWTDHGHQIPAASLLYCVSYLRLYSLASEIMRCDEIINLESGVLDTALAAAAAASVILEQEMVQLLLDRGADVNALTWRDKTVLIVAVSHFRLQRGC